MFFKKLFINLPRIIIDRNSTKQLLKNFKIPNKMASVNYFADAFLDRCSDQRKNKEWVAEQMKAFNTKFIIFHIDKPFVQDAGTQDGKFSSLYKTDYENCKKFFDKNCNFIFLGLEYKKLDQESELKSPYTLSTLYDRSVSKAWFAIDTFKYDENVENIVKLLDVKDGVFLDGNFIRMINIDPAEASVIAQARSIFCWHDRNQFCATCGTGTFVEEGGFKRTCPNQSCKSNNKQLHKYVPSNVSYPRTDPVVIMLIVNTQKTHFLLGRKKSFPKNMFSCLAGFLEVGESIEEAVKREIYEECGLFTTDIVFHSSQPWPFPSNIMIGCLAYASSDEIKIDQDELEEARWFSLSEIGQIIKNEHPDSVNIPPAKAIANRLINYWFTNRSKL